MTIARLTALLLAAIGLGLVATGCGGEEGPQIPRDEARNIVRRLQEADRRLSQDPPVCGDLSEDTIPALEDQVANLPEETDEGVRETMQDGVDHLRSLIEAECAARQEDTEETTSDTTEEEPAPDTDSEPELPDTDTEPDLPDTEPPDTDTEPPDTDTTPTSPTTPDTGGGQGVPEGAVRPKPGKGKKKGGG
ncbi:MAG TPA: hypothetical protein VF712_00175 [Thermoleophilaceae bacterium]|jgi:hypothetical protein